MRVLLVILLTPAYALAQSLEPRADSDRLVNLGTHRWSARPELGASQALGPWTIELSAGATWFTRNDQYFGGNTREQDPLYSAQLHLTRQLGRGAWGALSATYYEGGRTTLNGVARDDRQAYARTGTDFDTVGAAWQYLWGAGL